LGALWLAVPRVFSSLPRALLIFLLVAVCCFLDCSLADVDVKLSNIYRGLTGLRWHNWQGCPGLREP
jgi:hypothetical protein